METVALSGYTDSVFLAWLQRLLHLTEINIQQIFSASSVDARTTKLKANLVPFLQDGSFSPLVTHLQSEAELSGHATSESKRVFSPQRLIHMPFRFELFFPLYLLNCCSHKPFTVS